MGDLLGDLLGKWANAAERALATVVAAPLRTRARRRQSARKGVPCTQHIRNEMRNDARADQRQYYGSRWNMLQRRCRESELYFYVAVLSRAGYAWRICRHASSSRSLTTTRRGQLLQLKRTTWTSGRCRWPRAFEFGRGPDACAHVEKMADRHGACEAVSGRASEAANGSPVYKAKVEARA